jgi:hypothetical protein
MIKSRLIPFLMTSFVTLLAVSAASRECSAEDSNVYLISDGDFNTAANWNLPLRAPGTNLVDIYGIDDGLSATFSSGTTTVYGLRVGSGAKEHQLPSQETRFGRLTMTGGSLEVIGSGADGLFGVGRERENAPFGGDYNKDSVVNAADYTVWRNTLGSMSDLRADGDKNGVIQQADYDYWKARFGNQVKGGEFIMTGTSTVTANGVTIGERTIGQLSVGPDAVFESRPWFTVDETYGDPPITIMGPHFSPINTQDVRIGNFGPAYFTFIEPGLDGNGLIDVQGELNANTLLLSENGAKGEIRLSGGMVNLNGALVMSSCGGCVSPGTPANDAKLALQSSKVSIIGSSGIFNVGLDADPATPDPDLIVNSPFSRDIRFDVAGVKPGYPATATFSFTADAGGLTPITVVDNGLDSGGAANLSGTAYIGGAKLELNLDAYVGASPLTLIDAAAGHLAAGTFGTITFLGSRTATVNYDIANGDVFLDNFQNGAGAGSMAVAAVPEPSGLSLVAMLSLFICLIGARADRQRASQWGSQCATIRA